MKRKIVILTYSLCGGGAERFVAALLNNLDRNKYEIQLVLMNTDIDFEIPINQHIHYIEQSNRFESEFYKLIKLPFLARRFAKYCKEQQADLVFSVMSRPNMIATMAKLFGLRSRVLISERFYTPYYYNTNTFTGKLKKWLLKKCYVRADCILSNSAGTEEALKNEFRIRTDYKQIKNPADINEIKKLQQEPVSDPIDFNKFTFINVAGFRPEKNHNLLIEAAAQLKHRDFQLLLIGKGALLEKTENRVHKLGIADKTIFVPFTHNPFKYLHRSHCFILSSFVEGYPNVLIESMICGLPIISVDVKTGPRELLDPDAELSKEIKDGVFEITKYGVLTAYNSISSMVAAMNWALDNPASLKELMRNASEKVEAFGLQKVINDISAIFDQYLSVEK